MGRDQAVRSPWNIDNDANEAWWKNIKYSFSTGSGGQEFSGEHLSREACSGFLIKKPSRGMSPQQGVHASGTTVWKPFNHWTLNNGKNAWMVRPASILFRLTPLSNKLDNLGMKAEPCTARPQWYQTSIEVFFIARAQRSRFKTLARPCTRIDEAWFHFLKKPVIDCSHVRVQLGLRHSAFYGKTLLENHGFVRACSECVGSAVPCIQPVCIHVYSRAAFIRSGWNDIFCGEDFLLAASEQCYFIGLLWLTVKSCVSVIHG